MAIEHFSLISLIPPLFEDRPNHRLGQVILLCIKLNCRHRCALPEHDLAKWWWTAVAKNSELQKMINMGCSNTAKYHIDGLIVGNWYPNFAQYPTHCGKLSLHFPCSLHCQNYQPMELCVKAWPDSTAVQASELTEWERQSSSPLGPKWSQSNWWSTGPKPQQAATTTY